MGGVASREDSPPPKTWRRRRDPAGDMNAGRRTLEGALRPCLGVLCEVHHRCVRYAAVEGTRIPSANFIGHCADGQGGRPMFLPIEPHTLPLEDD